MAGYLGRVIVYSIVAPVRLCDLNLGLTAAASLTRTLCRPILDLSRADIENNLAASGIRIADRDASTVPFGDFATAEVRNVDGLACHCRLLA
jgi:hypothetical protein